MQRSRSVGRRVVTALLLAVAGLVLLGSVKLLVPETRRFVCPPLSKAEADVETLASAVEDYALEHDGRYPDSLATLVTPDENGRTYLLRDGIPPDPWGH